MKFLRMSLVVLVLTLAPMFGLYLAASAAEITVPPVRIAIVPGNGSGMEQEVCDRITDQMQVNEHVKVSTVNPDWFAVASIVDKTDPIALTIRVNGTLTIKTRDGHVIDTVSVQSNKQDFNMTPGTPAPMNKALVDSAAREVIGKLAERAVNPLFDAVQVEVDTRIKIIQATRAADEDNYEEALNTLMTITADTPHYKGARQLIAEYRMEQDALDSMNAAKACMKAGKYSQALAHLRAISPKSKRYSSAKQLIAQLTRRNAPRTAARPSQVVNSELKALEAQKKALEAQKQAIQAEETAIKLKAKSAR